LHLSNPRQTVLLFIEANLPLSQGNAAIYAQRSGGRSSHPAVAHIPSRNLALDEC